MTRRCRREASAGKSVSLTAPELRKLCTKWQKTLRLRDWDVKVQLVEMDVEDDLDDYDYYGLCSYSLANKTAVISIVNRPEVKGEHWGHDMEETLVHELMHLHTAPLCSEPDTDEEEQAVELVSKALVMVSRR